MSRTYPPYSATWWFCHRWIEHKRINHKDIQEWWFYAFAVEMNGRRREGGSAREVDEVIDLQSNTVDQIAYYISDGLLYLVWWVVCDCSLSWIHMRQILDTDISILYTQSCHTLPKHRHYATYSFECSFPFKLEIISFYFIRHRRKRAQARTHHGKTSPILNILFL